MISFPNAKINIGLNVVRKREDGFHDIESVFYPVPWRDMLEIVPAKDGNGNCTFTSTGIAVPSDGKPNLCEQVYHLLNDEFGLSAVKMHLHKIIPIGAGLGGGSADAAFAAVMLNDLFELGLSTEKLEGIVSKVGSDCPFFIKNRPAYVTGRGEVLEPMHIDLSGLWIVLIDPNIHISTAEAYSGITPSVKGISLREALNANMADWKNVVFNDFEKHLFEKHPQLSEIKNKLYSEGAFYASMTGSGSTVYGLFEKESEWIGNQNVQVRISKL